MAHENDNNLTDISSTRDQRPPDRSAESHDRVVTIVDTQPACDRCGSPLTAAPRCPRCSAPRCVSCGLE